MSAGDQIKWYTDGSVTRSGWTICLSEEKVNGRVRCGLPDESACAAECTARTTCTGYAFSAAEPTGDFKVLPLDEPIKPCHDRRPFKVDKARFDKALAAGRLKKATSHSMVKTGDSVVWKMGSKSDNHQGGSSGTYVSSVVTDKGGDSDSDYVKVLNLDGSSPTTVVTLPPTSLVEVVPTEPAATDS